MLLVIEPIEGKDNGEENCEGRLEERGLTSTNGVGVVNPSGGVTAGSVESTEKHAENNKRSSSEKTK